MFAPYLVFTLPDTKQLYVHQRSVLWLWLGNLRTSRAALNWFISGIFQPHADQVLHWGCKAISEVNPPPHQSWRCWVTDTVNEVNEESLHFSFKDTTKRIICDEWLLYAPMSVRLCYLLKEKVHCWPICPVPCLRLTERVRNSCVMWGAAVIVDTQARTRKDSRNRCLEHAHVLWYPTFQHKAEPAPPFPHTLRLKLVTVPNTLIARSVYANRPIVKHQWEVAPCQIVMDWCCIEDEVTKQMRGCSASLSLF